MAEMPWQFAQIAKNGDDVDGFSPWRKHKFCGGANLGCSARDFNAYRPIPNRLVCAFGLPARHGRDRVYCEATMA